jgi:hypothetical protein
VRVITSLKWQDKFEEFAETFAKLKDDLRDQVFLVIQLTTLETLSVATSTKVKVDRVDVRLSDIQALLRGRTAFEKEIAHFLDRNGGAARSLNDDLFLSRLVKKAEGWGEESEHWRENRSVHFELDSHPRRRTTSRRRSQEDDQASAAPPYPPVPLPPNAPPPPAPTLAPAPIPQAAYSPYTPRAPLSVQSPSAGGYYQVC